MIGAGALHAGARADVHVLIVGDPGMGKSQMLTAAVSHAGLQPRTSRPLLTRQLSAYAHIGPRLGQASLAPRGVYVCGNTSSSSGLTVTVVKDAITGECGATLTAAPLTTAPLTTS